MKIARYFDNGFSHLAVVRHGRLLDLPPKLSLFDILSMPIAERNVIEQQAGRQMNAPIENYRLLPPFDPTAIRDFVTFEKHISGMKKGEPGNGSIPEQWYETPVYIYMNPHVNFGAHDVIPMPPHTQALDFELEVAALILKKASDVSLDEASSFIAGYTIFNDWSARDIQGHEMRVGLGPSKGKDFANTFGPWLTTPDELEQYREGDRLNLEMTASVNGVPLGTDSLKNMSWSFEELLVHASRASVVGKGDVLASGTSSGGSLSEIWSRTGVREPKPLQVGDVVEMTVTGLGTIRNVIGEVTSPGHLVGKARRTYSEEEL
jgi:2-keto-4-pentenoate hydratase/2-oxohepta-3-ene-1,7-dioic acid hydratase in catechol pathway